MVSATMSSTCSWKTTTPSVSSSAGIRLGWRKRRSLQPCRLLRNGVIMSDLTGPGRNSEMSTMRSSKRLGPELADELALARALDLEHAQGAGGADQLVGGGVVVRHLRLVVEVDVLARDPRDLGDGVGHRRLHPDAEDVELEEAQGLDVVLVELAHREPQPARLDRGAVEQRRRWTARRRTGAARCAGAGRRGPRRGRRRRPCAGCRGRGCAARAGRRWRAGRPWRGCAGTPWRSRRPRPAAARARRRRRARRGAPCRCPSSTRR